MDNDKDKKLVSDLAGRDQALAMVRDNMSVIDCYARFHPDGVVRFLAGVALRECMFHSDMSIEDKDDNG